MYNISSINEIQLPQPSFKYLIVHKASQRHNFGYNS